MDGTITEPLLDFSRIKAEMGIGNLPILEALAAMDPADREHAQAVLLRHERDAAGRSTLSAGCIELMEWVDERRLGKALITRNSRTSVERVLALYGLRFDVLVTREDGKFKPDPEPLLRACERLKVRTEEAWM